MNPPLYPGVCVCGHPEAQHRQDQVRRRCSVYVQVAGVLEACGCKTFQERGEAA